MARKTRQKQRRPAMAEVNVTRIWPMRAAFVALALLVVFVQLLPLYNGPSVDVIQAMPFGPGTASVDAVAQGEQSIGEIIDPKPAWFAGPDLLVALLAAWALRRPEFVPMFLVAGLLVLADLLFLRPPGLWAATALIMIEWYKAQDRRLKDGSFATEWLTFALALLVATLIYRLVQVFTIVAPGSLYLVFWQYVTTVLVYPVCVVLSALFFGIRRTAPGDFDPMGRSA